MMSISSSRVVAPPSPHAADRPSKSCRRAKATSSKFSALLLLLAGCRQILGLEEGSVAKDAPTVEDVAVADMAIEDSPCKDSDTDGVCNTVDTWPCGPEPADLPPSVTWAEAANGDVTAIQLMNTTLDDLRKLVVAPGAMMQLKAQYAISDCMCPACLDQIEVGFSPSAGRQACIYDGNPGGSSMAGCDIPTTGSAQRSLTAPLTPGAYTLRFRLGQDISCGSGSTWWDNTEPPVSSSAVHLCVAAP